MSFLPPNQVITWSTADDFKEGASLNKLLLDAAKDFKGKVVFVSSIKDSQNAQPVTQFFGLEGAETPAVSLSPKWRPQEPLTWCLKYLLHNMICSQLLFYTRAELSSPLLTMTLGCGILF
jgi:hypothetical protein